MVTLEAIKQYLNVSHTDDDIMLRTLLDVAISYVKNYTGLTELEHKELELAVMQIVSSSYNQRDYLSETKLNVNRFVKSILDMHCQNLC